MQNVYNAGPKVGERHHALLRLASAWRRAGVPQEATTNTLIAWVPEIEPYDVKAVVHDVYTKGYRYSCNDPFMMKHCDPNCIFYTRKNYMVEAKNVGDLSRRLTQWAQMVNSGFSVKLHDWLGLDYRFDIYPGEVMVLFGDTGIGKSTLLMNIAVALKDVRWLWLSLENTEALTFRRMVQIECGLTKDEAMNLALEEKISTNGLEHIVVVNDDVTVDQLPQLVAEHDANVVVVDTLDCLGIEDFRGDINQRTEELGRILPGMARRCNTVFIIVHHISKEAAKQLRLTVHSGKGGSSVEQKADIAIGLNKHGDHMLLMESLKGRDVKPFSVSVEQNFDTATFLPIKET
jgi:archaellum biogenesis ATPase FlaH